jgi:hypothetical protein
MADATIPIEDWVDEIKAKISTSENIDMALLVLKATDYRMDLA